MAKTLFPVATHSGAWTAEEVQSLKRYIGVAQEEIIARILGRTIADVRAQIADLGRVHTDREWTQAELVELKRFYGTRTDEDIARIFGRPLASVVDMATELCLAKDKSFVRKLAGVSSTRMPRWSKEEIEQLKGSYADQSNLEIAQLLGRSVKSVVSKAHNLGLRKDRSRLAEMGRQNVSLRYGRRKDGTKDPDVDAGASQDSVDDQPGATHQEQSPSAGQAPPSSAKEPETPSALPDEEDTTRGDSGGSAQSEGES